MNNSSDNGTNPENTELLSTKTRIRQPQTLVSKKRQDSSTDNLSTGQTNSDCSVLCSIPKFKDCGGVGIGTGILQIILAMLYIFWKKKVSYVTSLNITNATQHIFNIHNCFLNYFFFCRVFHLCPFYFGLISLSSSPT